MFGLCVVVVSGGLLDCIVMGVLDMCVLSVSLFNVNFNGGYYLVEIDLCFIDYKIWLSLDYLLGQMGYLFDIVQKWLGDGYYEQKLVCEQIGQLIGCCFFDGYVSDEVQYCVLLEVGVMVVSEWGFCFGVVLIEVQMVQLISDIVWLVEQIVILVDGSIIIVLVLQVYLCLCLGDFDGNGVLLVGVNVDIKLGNGLVNIGNIVGCKLVIIDVGNIEYLGGSIFGQYVGLLLDKDICVVGVVVMVIDVLLVKVVGNVMVVFMVEILQGGGIYQYEINCIDWVVGLYVINFSGDGMLLVVVGGDISLQVVQICNVGVDGLIQLVVGGILDVGVIVLEECCDVIFDECNY